MKYPNMYRDLRDNIKILSDIEYQKKSWVRGEYPSGVQLDNFDLIIDFLFDDADLAEDPESAIGWFLQNKDQAAAVKKITDRIDVILDDHVGLTDEEYIGLDEWSGVVEAAQEALKLFPPVDPAVEEGAPGMNHSE